MTNNTPESSNVAGLQQGVVLRADDIAFNPHTIVDSWELETTIVGGQTINRYVYTLKDEMDWSYSVPSFLTPSPLANTNNLGIEMIYSWTARVVDNNGVSRTYSGTATYDNRVSGYQQELVPIMSAEALLGQIGGYGNGGQISDTVIIEDYYGYLEYKYYEYVPPRIEFILNGVTYACPEGITWGEYANLDTTEYPSSSNADVRWLDSTDGTGMQVRVNDIWYWIVEEGSNGMLIAVDEDSTIFAGDVYVIDELTGTWVIDNKVWTKTFSDGSLRCEFTGSGGASFYAINSGEIVEQNLKVIDLYGTASTSTYYYILASNSTGAKPYFRNAGWLDSSNRACVISYYYPSSGTTESDSNYASSVDGQKMNTINIKSPSFRNVVMYGKQLTEWLKANATKQGASTVAVADEPTLVSTDTPTTTAEGTWNEVERSESAEFVLYYPMIDTSGIRITNSEAYKAFYNRFSMPNMEKYVNTMGIPIPSLEVDYTSWIGTAVGGFLNMELMPNFSLGGILAILIAFAITMLFLKFFAGG